MGLFEHLPTHGINILQGNAGALRIVTAKEAAMNFIRNAKLAEQAYGLAQTDMIEVMKKRQVKAEQALRGLGKHPREPEEDDAHSAGKPLVKKEASLLYDTDKEEDAETKFDLDAASTAQELCHLPLNLVFDMDDSFSFHGSLGDIDLSDMFTKYYAECLGLPYDADNMADFLAIAGILFLTKRPTALQKKCFGDTYDAIHKKMKKLQPTVTREEEKSAKAFCRDCRDVFRDEERRSEDKNKAQKALRRRALEEDESALTELYLYGSKLHTICNPLSEADQISGFVLRMLSCVTDQADETRLAYTPTTPTTGSPFIRLFQNIKSEPRHPDLILKHKEEHDIGFGEVSHTLCFRKDTGDLCRCAIWSKRALDQLVTKYEGIDEIGVLFVQVVDRACTIYQIRRCGTICVATMLSTFSIVVSLDDLLAKFEDHAYDWLLFSRAFDNMLSMLRDAKKRKDCPPPCFIGLATSGARKMKKDCNSNRRK